MNTGSRCTYMRKTGRLRTFKAYIIKHNTHQIPTRLPSFKVLLLLVAASAFPLLPSVSRTLSLWVGRWEALLHLSYAGQTRENTVSRSDR